MTPLNLWTFHKGVNPSRYDPNATEKTIEHLKSKGYDVTWNDMGGTVNYTNAGDVYKVDYGSLVIFENPETLKFKVYDFGDYPKGTIELCKFKNFDGAVIGQYNPKLWENHPNVIAGHYPETHWLFGITNYEDVQNYRNSIPLDNRVYWRGSVYENTGQARYDGCRQSLRILNSIMSDKLLSFNSSPIPFDHYINESLNYKLCLSFGGGGGYSCGDYCFRDIEMYGLGIPVLRPKYHIQAHTPLIPDYHYVSVDIDDCINENFRVIDPTKVAIRLLDRYNTIINDTEFLNFVSNNARQWYVDVLSYPNVINNLLGLLNL